MRGTDTGDDDGATDIRSSYAAGTPIWSPVV